MAFSYSLSVPVSLTELAFKLILPLMIPVLFYSIKRRTKAVFLRELEELRVKIRETKDRVERKEMETQKRRRPEVKDCLTNVDEFLQGGVKKFQESTFYRVPLVCDFWCWMADLVDQIREWKNKISGLADPLVGTTPRELPFVDLQRSIVGGLQTLDDIRGHLEDEQVGIIGVHGMRGIGKTTYLSVIAHELWRKFDMPEDHEGQGSGPVLIWAATISGENPIPNLQKAIGDYLGLSLPTTPDASEGSAAAIRMMLERKQFTLLLDGVPEGLQKWEDVGIPLPRPGDKCRIVFTAHSQKTCKALKPHKTVEVRSLNKDESWSLFERTVGRENLQDISIEEVAMDMSTKCGGLPDVLVTVASAMTRCQTLAEWEEALEWWNAPVTATTPPGMEYVTAQMKNVFNKMSNYLNPSTTLGSCLLYCSLFPEGQAISVPRLVDYWIGEGFVNVRVLWEWNRVRRWAYNVVREFLCDCSLVSNGHEEGEVLLHDVVRRTAMWMTGREENESNIYLTSVTIKLSGGCRLIDWADAKRISFIGSEKQVTLDDCRTMRRCPKLLTLLLNHKGDTLQKRLPEFVPEAFFPFISNLRVLDLSGVDIDPFPSGITSLVELNYLNLSDTNIRELPGGIKKLEKLRQLHLRRTPRLSEFPQESISKYRLQALDLYCSNVDSSKLKLEEFKDLSELGLSLTSTSPLERLLGSDKLSTSTAFLQLHNVEGLLPQHLSQVFQIMKNLRQLSVKNPVKINFSIKRDQLPKLEILSLANVVIVINPQGSGELLKSLQKLHTDYEDLTEISWVRQLPRGVIISPTRSGGEEITEPMTLHEFIKNAFSDNTSGATSLSTVSDDDLVLNIPDDTVV